MSRARSSASAPERRCVGCRQAAPADGLLRFVVAEGRLHVDVSRKLAGRGAWAHAQAGCLERGLKRGGFAYALKQKVQDEVERVIDLALEVSRGDALQRMGLLRRSGALSFGRDAVTRTLGQRPVAALWLAQDAADRTGLALRRLAERHGLAVVVAGERDEVAAALGTAPVAVAALPAGKAGERTVHALELWGQLLSEAKVYKAEKRA